MIHYKVGYLVGSLAAENLTFTEIPFRDLPLYSYDYDKNYPPVAQALKDSLKAVPTAPIPSPTSRPPSSARRPARSAPLSPSRA